MICAVRFCVARLLGKGAGGMELGVSRVFRAVCSWLTLVRAAWREEVSADGVEEEGWRERLLEAASIWSGRWV